MKSNVAAAGRPAELEGEQRAHIGNPGPHAVELLDPLFLERRVPEDMCGNRGAVIGRHRVHSASDLQHMTQHGVGAGRDSPRSRSMRPRARGTAPNSSNMKWRRAIREPARRSGAGRPRRRPDRRRSLDRRDPGMGRGAGASTAGPAPATAPDRDPPRWGCDSRRGSKPRRPRPRGRAAPAWPRSADCSRRHRSRDSAQAAGPNCRAGACDCPRSDR